MSGKLKILNLYAGIGGNRKLWDEVAEDLEVTAVEIDEMIAGIYQGNFPQDEVVIDDAHGFLERNYEGWDFIWSSPPCPTHSKLRNIAGVGRGQDEPLYPDMRLYQEIIFLNQIYNSTGVDFTGKWVVENVVSYYEPLIRPQKVGRHYLWSNFFISEKNIPTLPESSRGSIRGLQSHYGLDLPHDLKDNPKLHPKDEES